MVKNGLSRDGELRQALESRDEPLTILRIEAVSTVCPVSDIAPLGEDPGRQYRHISHLIRNRLKTLLYAPVSLLELMPAVHLKSQIKALISESLSYLSLGRLRRPIEGEVFEGEGVNGLVVLNYIDLINHSILSLHLQSAVFHLFAAKVMSIVPESIIILDFKYTHIGYSKLRISFLRVENDRLKVFLEHIAGTAIIDSRFACTRWQQERYTAAARPDRRKSPDPVPGAVSPCITHLVTQT